MTRLIQVFLGTWLNPDSVTGLYALDACEMFGKPIPPRVELRLGGNSDLTWKCASLDEARAMADRIASLVNGEDA